MNRGRMIFEGIYYLAREASQFASIAPIWSEIGGKFLTWEFQKNRIARQYPFREWKVRRFNKNRNLSGFYRQLEVLFPGCEAGSIRHYYLGPFPADLKVLICTSMWPIPPRTERNFVTMQFYHGVSDKRYKVGVKRNELPPMYNHWDYWMLPGEKDKQKLLKACQKNGIEIKPEQLVAIGYLRFDKIINHQYDRMALLKHAGIPDNGRINILFAPTWKWGGGTLMNHYKKFCDLIPQRYNLIIRNHIHDNRNIEVVKKYCREKRIEHVYFVNDLIMNITDNIIFADLMISDTSSVMYDFLIMDRPLIINKTSSKDVYQPEKRFDIRRCGLEFDIEKDNILDTIECSFTTDEFRSAITEVRHNCFYHLDGKATERTVRFIKDILNR